MKRQRDYKLGFALKGTKYWGSYITDILKGIPKTNSDKIIKYAKWHPADVQLHIKNFCREL